MNLREVINHDDSPTVLVQGIGQMKLSQAKMAVQAIVENLTRQVNQNSWKEIKSTLDHGILQAYINAIVEAQSKQH